MLTKDVRKTSSTYTVIIPSLILAQRLQFSPPLIVSTYIEIKLHSYILLY